METIIKGVRNEIKLGALEKAVAILISELEKLSKYESFFNSFLAFSSNLNVIEKKYLNSVIYHQEYQIERQKITIGVLETISELSQSYINEKEGDLIAEIVEGGVPKGKLEQKISALEKRNEKLKEKNDELLSLFYKSSPDLKLLMNNGDEINLNYIKKINHKDYEPIIPLELEAIPSYINFDKISTEIREYNKTLAKKRLEIESFNDIYELYFRKLHYSNEIRINVLNHGLINAKNVYIHIVIPNELILLSSNEFQSIKKPSSPEILPNPIKKAIKEFNDFLERKNPNKLNLQYLEPLSLKKHYLTDYLIHSETNEIIIKIETIEKISTKGIWDEYYLVPLRTGIFEIKVSIECTDIKKKIAQKIRVSVN